MSDEDRTDRPIADDAEPCERSAPICVCGADLPPACATGRPRRFCSAACRRRVDRLSRQLKRRLAWLEEWRAHRGHGLYSDEQIARELADVEADITELRGKLTGSVDILHGSGQRAS